MRGVTRPRTGQLDEAPRGSRLVARVDSLERDTPADREELVREDVARLIKMNAAGLVEAFAACLTTISSSEREEDHIGFGVVAELHADLVRG